ncbi:MucB/RseB C-terminal domain-containing protein [Glaciecola petra]|uniref:MucB/RseB C-terminal domain-containing protein n=1 Tax=Glaciecola petra TaxID=3075602 RepID=A0ABU2ZU68_9ALTE|nr:MucB/RseB C-terminal domain-containing protein [Aestuariibacter sp. P117]MDT0595811.1 MucB/RseB C-terminal domain-containing protein [Aestuariibacter sp. P117]
MLIFVFLIQKSYAQIENTELTDNASEQAVNNVPSNVPSSTPTKIVVQPTFDQLSARSWFERLSNTLKNINFEIAYVVSRPNRDIMPYVWRHAILENGDSAEQLSLLNGPGYEQIRLNNKVSIFEPSFNPYSIRAENIEGPIPSAFIHDPNILYAAYDVLLMGRNRILGRMSQQIRIVSKDNTRFGYHLWLDEQTGLILKLNMYDENKLIKQIQVTQLSLSADVKAYFANIQAEQLPPTVFAKSPQEIALPWDVGFIPVGMKKVRQKEHLLRQTGQPVQYVMLSDGVVDVSVYVLSATEALQDDLSMSADGTSVVSMSDGNVQVTVVGEIPTKTANKIANSIVVVNSND